VVCELADAVPQPTEDVVSAQDPQATTGSTAGYETAPPCRCGHPSSVHQPTGRTTRYLGACSAHTPAACGCRIYGPREAS
jgi:hypothetical protein